MLIVIVSLMMTPMSAKIMMMVTIMINGAVSVADVHYDDKDDDNVGITTDDDNDNDDDDENVADDYYDHYHVHHLDLRLRQNHSKLLISLL